MSPSLPEISVIVPVYMNHDTLADLHARVSDMLSGLVDDHEFVFVDDRCPQNSIEVLTALARTDQRVSVIGMAENVGQQNAVLMGLKSANGNTAIIMDADLQDPPSAIPLLIAKLNEGYDVAFAGRRGSYQPIFRLLTSRLYKWALHIISGVPVDAGLFMAIRKYAVGQLLQVRTDNPHLVAMLGILNLRMISTPVERDKRQKGVSAYTSWMRLKVGLGAAFWALKWKLGIRDKIKDATDQPQIQVLIRNKYSKQET